MFKSNPGLAAGSYEHRMRSARLPKLRRAKINFHHACGTVADTSADPDSQCKLDLEVADGHFYQLNASRHFHSFADNYVSNT